MLEGYQVLALADSGSPGEHDDTGVRTRMGLSSLTTGQTCELSPASGWTW